VTAAFDARKTGWTIGKCLNKLAEYDDDPYRHVYYSTYSDHYHTDPDCPHIQDSESLHLGNSVHDFAAPWCLGSRVPRDLDECSWCASRTDWKFDGHRDEILDGEKSATVRPGGRAAKVSEDDTILLRTAAGDVFATAPVTAAETRTVCVIVRDGVDGHRDYADVAEFREEFTEYYPEREFDTVTELTVIHWGDVTHLTDDT